MMLEYITDKMPNNFLRVGLIKTILPNAKIIHCMRNPMDNCFSIFKTDFTGTHGYAYDMVELGQYYNLYRDLMAHWEKVLPGFMYTLRYEEMISDQQNQTKRLLDFCGLPWDEACLAFHKTERRVSTASLAQVRQPIYKDSVELWKRYEKQLEPLRKTIIWDDCVQELKWRKKTKKSSTPSAARRKENRIQALMACLLSKTSYSRHLPSIRPAASLQAEALYRQILSAEPASP